MIYRMSDFFFINQVDPVIRSKIFFVSWEIRVTAPFSFPQSVVVPCCVRYARDYRAYTVPMIEFHKCIDCGEKIYDPQAMRNIEAHSPAFAGKQRGKVPA